MVWELISYKWEADRSSFLSLHAYAESIDVKISLDWQQGCTKYFIPGYLTPFRFVCAYLFWSPKLPSWCSSICDVMVSHWKSWFMTPQTLDLRDGSFGGQNKCAQTNRNGANYPGIKYYLHPRCQSRDIFTSIVSTYTCKYPCLRERTSIILPYIIVFYYTLNSV